MKRDALLLVCALATGCSSGSSVATGPEQDDTAGVPTITFAAVRFNPNNPPANFVPAPSAELKAGGQVAVVYPAARMAAVDVTCAPGEPIRMGSMINRDPLRVTETPMQDEKTTFSIPSDASRLDFWFICKGTNGQDQFDNDNPMHVTGATDNYVYSPTGGSGLLFAASVGDQTDVLHNAFRVFLTPTFTKHTNPGDSQQSVLEEQALTIEYTDKANAFPGASSITAIANIVIFGAAADGEEGRVLDPNHQFLLKPVGNGVYRGTLTDAFKFDHVPSDDEIEELDGVQLAFLANGKFDSNNSANYALKLQGNPVQLP